MKNAYLLLLSLLFFSCGESDSGPKTSAYSPTKQAMEMTDLQLELAWESDTTLTTVEAVFYDTDRKRLYTSNIENGPWEMDGEGSLSILSTDGEILNRNWVRGLNAPKGMGRKGNRLFVADVNAVVEIDIEQATIIKRHEPEGATNLNDITVSTDGTLYVSDSGTGKVLKMTETGFEVVADEGITRPNGLLALNNILVIGDTRANEALGTLDLATGQFTERTPGLGPDGIVAIGDGEYIVSRWQGKIWHIDANWKETLLLDTEADKVFSADIEYIPEEKLLLVPTFFANKVMAYRLK